MQNEEKMALVVL